MNAKLCKRHRRRARATAADFNLPPVAYNLYKPPEWALTEDGVPYRTRGVPRTLAPSERMVYKSLKVGRTI